VEEGGNNRMRDLENRVRRLQKLIVAQDVDLVAIGPTTHMRYLLGNAPFADERLCLLVVGGDELQMIVPKVNAETISSFTDIELIPWEDTKGPKSALETSLLGRRKVRRLAVDGAMRTDFLLPLLSMIESAETFSADSMMSLLRVTKSPEEVEALFRAAQQADRAMQAAIEACGPGVTEQEVAWEAEVAFRKDGAEAVAFTIVAAGENGAYPHHDTGQRAIRAGEGVVIDIGASLNSYMSDITRTAHVGEPSGEFQRVYDVVLEANEKGRAAVCPGIPAQKVDAAARRVVEEAGFGAYFIHRTGHGIGLDTHEAPWIMEGNDQPLEPGMAFSVEPGVYLPGRFGVRIEDIVVVEEEGVRTLTEHGRDLIIKG
jgi:Xaa-Pro aminopeptidase